MKQVLQSLKTGKTEVCDIAIPRVGSGQLLIRTECTLISSGTERMLVDFGKANLINKAKQQPEKVKMVLQKFKTDGLKPTIDAVYSKLDQPLPLGYCNVGRVSEIGSGVHGFSVGDRVVSNGKHAEFVLVPPNLCCKIPDSVSNEDAAFTVIGSIALQGLRLAAPELGEVVVVIGLGLVGLLTAQLLKSQGCRVLGMDFVKANLDLARSFGIEALDLKLDADPVKMALGFSRGRGADAVIIAAATASSEPIHQAAMMSRKKGRIVLVGTSGLELSRADFFEKELTFQVSCSYGPGRYDPTYEQQGIDYPVGYVRWTEQRNFEAMLDMLALGGVNPSLLISHNFNINDAVKAYDVLTSDQQSMGILLSYPKIEITDDERKITIDQSGSRIVKKSEFNQAVSFIGAGNYTSSILLPAFKKANAHFQVIASRDGVSGLYCARKFNFNEHTTEPENILSDPETDTIVITTRHDTHAEYIVKSIAAGKNIFVEKPLCLNLEELDQIQDEFNGAAQKAILMVGYNRRFSSHSLKIKELLTTESSPKTFIYTINAGEIPAEHWTQDQNVGGGRLIGEACHFIDLLRFLTDSQISEFSLNHMSSMSKDTFSINLKFTDGSIGTIHYFANGPKTLPKERLEIFTGNKALQLNNWRHLKGYGWSNFRNFKTWQQDKGQSACVKVFLNALTSQNTPPIPIPEIFEVADVTIRLSLGENEKNY